MSSTYEEIIDGLEKGEFSLIMKAKLSKALEEEIPREELLDLDDLIYGEEYDKLREELDEREILNNRLEYEEYISGD